MQRNTSYPSLALLCSGALVAHSFILGKGWWSRPDCLRLAPAIHRSKLRQLKFSYWPAIRSLLRKKRFHDSVGWWSRPDSNWRPHACKARALPTELLPRLRLASAIHRSKLRRASPSWLATRSLLRKKCFQNSVVWWA